MTQSSRWTLNSPGSAESWLEIFFLSACVGTELAPLLLPAPSSRFVASLAAVAPADSRGCSEQALKVPWLSGKNGPAASLTSFIL